MRAFSRLTLLHLFANALLLGLGYYWLGIRESRTATLLGSALLAAVIAALACCAYAAPLAYFQTADRRALASWRAALHRLVPLAAAASVILVVYWLLARWQETSGQPAFQIASYLTLKLSKPVRPAVVLRVFNTLTWIVRWIVLPVLFLPMISAILDRGWSGFSAIGGRARRWIYWIEVPVLLLCVIWLPRRLVAWVPVTEGFGWEMSSFVARAVFAYLLFSVAWLVLAFVTSEGTPRVTQPSTEVSP